MALPSDQHFAKWYETVFKKERFFDMSPMFALNKGFVRREGDFVQLSDNPTEAEAVKALEAAIRRPIMPHLVEASVADGLRRFGLLGDQKAKTLNHEPIVNHTSKPKGP